MKSPALIYSTMLALAPLPVSGPEIGPGLSRIDLAAGPGLPIPPGQCAITALALSAEGQVYGGTSAERGKSSYLFRIEGQTIQILGSLEALPGAERVVNALVVGGDGALYGGTTNYCEEEEVPPDYAGGHLFRCDPGTGKIEDLGVPIPGQGINCLVLSPDRSTAYGLSYPGGHLLVWDLGTGAIQDHGPTVSPPQPIREPKGAVFLRYRPRALVLDGRGRVYGTRDHGFLWRYDPQTGTAEPLPAQIPGARGREGDWLYNHVADAFCLGRDGLIYGGTAADGYLFSFDPESGRVVNLGKPVRESRLRSLVQGADGWIYALAGEENGMAHLVTYDPQTRGMEDLGAIGPDVWSWTVYRAGAMAAHPSGRIFIGEAERLSALVVYDPAEAARQGGGNKQVVVATPEEKATKVPAPVSQVKVPEGGAAALFRYKVFAGWEGADSIWGDLCVARDGRVYVGVGNHLAVGGNSALYCYDPRTDELSMVADIGQVSGQFQGSQAVGQGKIHTRVMEGSDGRIYGGTMMGGHYTYRLTDYAHPRGYPGGHLWAYDPATGQTQDLGIPVPREAVYSIWVDGRRGKIYGQTFHHHLFFVYDLETRTVEVKGNVGVGEDVYMDTLGMVYTNGPWGNVTRYNPDTDELTDLPLYFPRRHDGTLGINGPNMAQLGRDGMIYSTTLWGCIYRFNPYENQITPLGYARGDGSEWEYTPNLTLSRNEQTLYYLSGCHGHYLAAERQGVHFVEMDVATGRRTDHGLVVTDPLTTGCFASGTGPDGTLYFAAQCWGEIIWGGRRVPPGPPVLMIHKPE